MFMLIMKKNSIFVISEVEVAHKNLKKASFE